MNGPDHYRQAEKLLREAEYIVGSDVLVCVSLAQVHATLALAAATALPEDAHGMRSLNGAAWVEAAGTRRPAAGGDQ